jgi:hypothetical protein
MSRYKSISVDVDVDLSNFDDEDLIEELEAAGYSVYKNGLNPRSDSFQSLATEMLVAKTNGDADRLNEYVKRFIEMVLDKRV